MCCAKTEGTTNRLPPSIVWNRNRTSIANIIETLWNNRENIPSRPKTTFRGHSFTSPPPSRHCGTTRSRFLFILVVRRVSKIVHDSFAAKSVKGRQSILNNKRSSRRGHSCNTDRLIGHEPTSLITTTTRNRVHIRGIRYFYGFLFMIWSDA